MDEKMDFYSVHNVILILDLVTKLWIRQRFDGDKCYNKLSQRLDEKSDFYSKC